MKKILLLITILILLSLSFIIIQGWIVMSPDETIKVYCPANLHVYEIEVPGEYPGRAFELDCFWVITQ